MLTDAAIRRAKPQPPKVLKLWDENGLYLAVMPTGSKLWRQKFRRDGKEQTLSFGPYPEVSLARARELCIEAREKLRQGIVPAGKRRQAIDDTPKPDTPNTPTFEEIARRWHAQQTALIFARTETEAFFSGAWGSATAMLFLRGRLTFHREDGTPGGSNSGAPSVLLAYGDADAEALRFSGLPGAFVRGWEIQAAA